jgi:transmembrane protein DUF3566
VSVNGAEEDGVDNRVEAPAWASDGGADGATKDQKPDSAQSVSGESAAPASTSESAGPRAAQDKAAKPSVGSAAIAPAGEPGWRPDAGGQVAAAAPPLGSSPAQRNSSGHQDPLYGAGQAQPSQAQTAQFPAAVGAAAEAARGLASKVSAPFSGLTKPKPKGKPKSKGRRPSGAGLPPKRQQGPADRRQPGLNYGPSTGPQPRRAQLRLDRIEPWSVMKFSFLISLVGWVILFVAVAIMYFVLSKLGVFTSVEHTVGLVTSNKSNPTGSNASSWFQASRILGYTMLIGAVNVVLMTALATIGAVLYNLVTALAGGIEVTLKESD